jgi:hypothetical protein
VPRWPAASFGVVFIRNKNLKSPILPEVPTTSNPVVEMPNIASSLTGEFLGNRARSCHHRSTAAPWSVRLSSKRSCWATYSSINAGAAGLNNHRDGIDVGGCGCTETVQPRLI